MKIYNRITPEGTRDVLFEQCDARRKAEKILSGFFRSRGFREVMTPGLEFYDVFYSNATYFPQETMYKLTDSRGRLLVLRPDCTIPIARLTATKLSGLPRPLRLFYDQNIFRCTPALRGASDEIGQMGVELIGAGAPKGDLEVLETAARSLSLCEVENFRLEICHIGLFKGLMEELDASREEKEEVRSLIEAKDYAGLGDVLSSFPDSPAARALRRLPRLFGGREVLREARQFARGEKYEEILDSLEALYDSLERLGLEGKVLVDLGLVNEAEYYTGIIFRGYLEDVGEPVLSGGRYDRLMEDFGESLPATGFAVNLELLSRKLPPEESFGPPRVLIHSADPYDVRVFPLLEELSGKGILCENSVFPTLEEAVAYASGVGMEGVWSLEGDQVRKISVKEGAAMRPLRLALTKGRLEEKTVSLLEDMGLDCSQLHNKGRRLVLDLPGANLQVVLVKAADVITYVERGACDLGVVGKDVIMEMGKSFYEVLDLGFGRCRFAVAAPRGFRCYEGYQTKTIATKYPNVTRRFFEGKADGCGCG